VSLRYLWNVHSQLLGGLRITVQATLIGMGIAVLLGLLIAMIRLLRIPVLRQLSVGWIVLVRNTPLLAQLFFLFYVLPSYGVKLNAYWLGTIGLGCHYSCYTAEAFRGSFAAVARGQWEAATVLGLSWRTTFAKVVLPQALPAVVPTLGNYLISMFKDSSILSAITVLELLGTTQALASQSFMYTTLFTAMGLTYLCIAYPASIGVRRLEKRLSGGRRVA